MPVQDAIFDMMNSSSASGCLKIACGHYSDGLMPCGLDALDVVSLFDHPNLGGVPWTSNSLGARSGLKACFTSPRSFTPEAFASADGTIVSLKQLPETVWKACAITSSEPRRGPPCARKSWLRSIMC